MNRQVLTERRRHFDPVTPVAFVAVQGNCKWVCPDGYMHAYCVGMGWTLLVKEPDGLLFQAPPDFDTTGMRAKIREAVAAEAA
jgi:hypothetical protein